MILNLFLVMFALQTVSVTEAAIAPDRAYEAVITGMTCGGCAREVSTLLQKIPAVKSVEVDHKAGKATVTMDGETVLAKASVDSALKGSKFAATSLEEKKAPESRPRN